MVRAGGGISISGSIPFKDYFIPLLSGVDRLSELIVKFEFTITATMGRCYRVICVLFLLIPWIVAAQGSIVLVGGGSEGVGDWSDAPYKWIVDHAPNKRVAVISYAEEDDWIPNYFVSLGASAAVNIKITSRAVADLQGTYDALMTFDAFFFKGGDQSIYYREYKGTKTMQAAIDKLVLSLRDAAEKGREFGEGIRLIEEAFPSDDGNQP